ncbi:integrase regulator R protein [Burkholderia pseudomallei]|nr:integrase regulator R protein [Burkholderia pseudomallei]
MSTMHEDVGATRRFVPLEQTAFQRLEHAAYLKGLLKPFKGKGDLEVWASQCEALRDALIALAERSLLPQARRPPFDRLPVFLAQQHTGAGTTFLRWRNLDRSAMGVTLWDALLDDPRTPAALIDDLHAIELQRIALNMQISLLHTLARQAHVGVAAMAHADDHYHRVARHAHSKESSS